MKLSFLALGFFVGMLFAFVVCEIERRRTTDELIKLRVDYMKQHDALVMLNDLYTVEKENSENLRKFIYQELKKGAGAR